MQKARILAGLASGLIAAACIARSAAAEPSLDPAPALDLTALAGQVVYLDFWASWCAPCRQSFRWMNRMQRELARDGFVVVAVNVDHARADADQFLQGHVPGFRIVFDPDGALAARYGVKGMPTSFLIDRNGQIHSEQVGFRLKDRAALEQEIRSLLAARRPANQES
jgi:cytochrome c biogenesis protein CcmG/thiol:disulfide interchange protein DsbE